MIDGLSQDASKLLSAECGLIGIQRSKSSAIYLPIRSSIWFPPVRMHRVFAKEPFVSIFVIPTESYDTVEPIRIFFSFQGTQISKIHLSKLADVLALPFENFLHELSSTALILPAD